jgi:hypothetical protein
MARAVKLEVVMKEALAEPERMLTSAARAFAA